MHKKFAALLCVLMCLALLAGCGPNQWLPNPDASATQAAPAEPDTLTFTAQVNQLLEDGTPYSLITADPVGFSWLYINQDDLPALGFAPEFGQTVEVELVPGTLKPDRADNLGTATATVKSMRPAVPAVVAQYVRANGPYDEPKKQKTVVIESKKQLEAYYRANRNPQQESWEPGKYNFDYAHDGSKSFAEVMTRYDEAFFAGYLLVLAILVEGSGSYRHIVTGVEGNVINIRKIVSYPATADMAGWHIMVEISREDRDGTEFALAVTEGDTAAARSANLTSTTTGTTKPPVKVVAAKAQKFATPAAGANDFAFRLSRVLLQGNGKKNFICSPYSVWLPLAALVNATDAAHKPALLNALGVAGFNEKDLNEAAAEMLDRLTLGGGKANPLRIANAIFVDKKVTLRQDFKKTFADSYRGIAQTVDFASPSAVKIVNDWASKNTDGLIKNIIQEFAPDAVAAIANAIYFSDRWEREFKADQTEKDTFHGVDGDTEAQFMLREGNSQIYYEDNELQAMPLSFQTGGGLYVLLPRNGDANALLSSMDPAYFERIQNGAAPATGKLLLPRFKIDSGGMKLIDVLAALGVPLVDPRLAPLTGLIEESPVYISDAVQKAVIEVDEKGTTATAVTVMTMRAASTMPQPTKPFSMVCDKPFAFVLYGSGGQILFTGVVNQI